MQIRTLWQPVRKAGVRILCQVLLFDIWLLMATALSSPSLGPHMLKAHGICLTCGLCRYSDKAREVHTLVWVTDTESSCKYSFFSWRGTCIHSGSLLSCKGSLKEHWISWLTFSRLCLCGINRLVTVGIGQPGTPYSHFIPFLTNLTAAPFY